MSNSIKEVLQVLADPEDVLQRSFWRRVQSIIAHKQLILAEIGLVSTDLMTPDVDAAHTFYQVVFEWEYNIGGLELRPDVA